jgi:hypothetical protein
MSLRYCHCLLHTIFLSIADWYNPHVGDLKQKKVDVITQIHWSEVTHLSSFSKKCPSFIKWCYYSSRWQARVLVSHKCPFLVEIPTPKWLPGPTFLHLTYLFSRPTLLDTDTFFQCIDPCFRFFLFCSLSTYIFTLSLVHLHSYLSKTQFDNLPVTPLYLQKRAQTPQTDT